MTLSTRYALSELQKEAFNIQMARQLAARMAPKLMRLVRGGGQSLSVGTRQLANPAVRSAFNPATGQVFAPPVKSFPNLTGRTFSPNSPGFSPVPNLSGPTTTGFNRVGLPSQVSSRLTADARLYGAAPSGDITAAAPLFQFRAPQTGGAGMYQTAGIASFRDLLSQVHYRSFQEAMGKYAAANPGGIWKAVSGIFRGAPKVVPKPPPAQELVRTAHLPSYLSKGFNQGRLAEGGFAPRIHVTPGREFTYSEAALRRALAQSEAGAPPQEVLRRMRAFNDANP